ncbi:MAG: DUF2149 domain-containing protein [Phycisphaerae bacterium]|nr:DUF2149 domain-containing protein [Phycisphaerae bacterium]
MFVSRTYKTKGKASLSHHFLRSLDDDPLGGVANLFDVAMVFAVALILALFTALQVPELLNNKDDFVIVKNPGKLNMEIIQKKGVKLEKYKMSTEETGGQGQRLGICYQLANGEVVYVPENSEQLDSDISQVQP